MRHIEILKLIDSFTSFGHQKKIHLMIFEFVIHMLYRYLRNVFENSPLFLLFVLDLFIFFGIIDNHLTMSHKGRMNKNNSI